MAKKKQPEKITGEMALRAKGPWAYGFVRGFLQIGLPLAAVMSFGMAAYRWGPNPVYWNWGSFALSLGVNFAIIPFLGLFLGRALFYKKK